LGQPGPSGLSTHTSQEDLNRLNHIIHRRALEKSRLPAAVCCIFLALMTKMQPAPQSGVLTEEQLANSYVQILHNISVRAVGTDAERQAMADAVREFYDLATDAIRFAEP
jgi:hypothetical protein